MNILSVVVKFLHTDTNVIKPLAHFFAAFSCQCVHVKFEAFMVNECNEWSLGQLAVSVWNQFPVFQRHSASIIRVWDDGAPLHILVRTAGDLGLHRNLYDVW